MERADAVRGMALLVAGCSGFTDASVDLYVSQISEWRNGDAFIAACQRLAVSWPHGYRPSIDTVRQCYNGEILRRESMTPALPRGDADAEEIAARQARYREICAQMHREPKPEVLEGIARSARA